MHASTASACLRRLSDWVNSVSKHHAAARSFMLSYLFSPGLRWFVLVFMGSSGPFHARMSLTSTGLIPQITLHVGCLTTGSYGLPPLWQLPKPRWPRLLPRSIHGKSSVATTA